jgi:hypothetical protein
MRSPIANARERPTSCSKEADDVKYMADLTARSEGACGKEGFRGEGGER